MRNFIGIAHLLHCDFPRMRQECFRVSSCFYKLYSLFLFASCHVIVEFFPPLAAQKMRPRNDKSKSPSKNRVPPNHAVARARKPLKKIRRRHADCQCAGRHKGGKQRIVRALKQSQQRKVGRKERQTKCHKAHVGGTICRRFLPQSERRDNRFCKNKNRRQNAN